MPRALQAEFAGTFALEDRTPRQNWGKFKAHKWGGEFTGRSKCVIGGQPKYGETRCYIRDPDGYIIEVGQSNPGVTYG